MIRAKADHKKGRQPLSADCGGGHHYREAVSYMSDKSNNLILCVLLSLPHHLYLCQFE